MTSENDGNALIISKEHPHVSISDEGSSGSTTSQGRDVLKKGPWTSAEDALLIKYVKDFGEGNWNAVKKESGLSRCGKSCRLRWANHLRPHLKKGSFSPEEEGIIVKLHSQMGNKWAHMATHLHGRTDNEIKNYWNTRVKRQQRAGLPLYPPQICVQDLNENKLLRNSNTLSSGDQHNHGVSQGTMCGIPDYQFGPYEPCVKCRSTDSDPLPYAPTPFPDITFTGIPTHGLGSHACNHLNPGEHAKQSTVSEASFPGFHISVSASNSDPIYLNPGLAYPYDADPRNENLESFSCAIPGNPALSNVNISSSRTLLGTLKMELPSLQSPETNFLDCNTSASCTFSCNAVDAQIQSPKDESLLPYCDSLRNDGLLEDLVYGSQALSSGKKRSFKEISADSVTPSDTDPNSPFCPSAVSLFNECNPIIISLFDEFPSYGASLGLEEIVLNTKQVPAVFESFEGTPNAPDFSMPDVLLGSDWFLGNSAVCVGDITVPDFREGRAPVKAGASFSVSLKSHPWTSMPCALEMPEK